VLIIHVRLWERGAYLDASSSFSVCIYLLALRAIYIYTHTYIHVRLWERGAYLDVSSSYSVCIYLLALRAIYTHTHTYIHVRLWERGAYLDVSSSFSVCIYLLALRAIYTHTHTYIHTHTSYIYMDTWTCFLKAVCFWMTHTRDTHTRHAEPVSWRRSASGWREPCSRFGIRITSVCVCVCVCVSVCVCVFVSLCLDRKRMVMKDQRWDTLISSNLGT
jgi:hypothetical protein